MINEELTELRLPYPEQEDRLVRVYVPAHEEGETFPVIYMTDGQNLFDAESTRFGSWLTREAVRDEQKRSGKAAVIVGIHNDYPDPRRRNNELTPNSIGKVKGFLKRTLAFTAPQGEVFARFVTDTVMPAVEARFPVKTGKENTAFCGSSSGGLESFFIGLSNPDRFAAVGAFSPVFNMYAFKDLKRWIQSRIQPDMPLLFVYTGGTKGVEKGIYRGVLETLPMLRECYPADKLISVIKPEAMHKESAWEPIFRDFLRVFLIQIVNQK